MGPEAQTVVGIFIAALGGAAVGVERQRSGHASGPNTHFAGVRTFTLLGALGGIAGALWTAGLIPLATVLLAGGVGLTVSAYFAASRTDIDGTTEVAALVVLAAATFSGHGWWRAGSGVTAATALLLAEKSTLHRLVERLSEPGLRAGFRFAVMALVVLPLLPPGPYGPLGGIRPQELWALVLFFSGLSFLGFIARAAAGPRGHILAGVFGGLISSTNVTFSYSRLSRTEPALQPTLAMGVVAACTVLYFRVSLACAVLYWPLAIALWPYLLLPAATGVGIALWGVSRTSSQGGHASEATNPLQFMAALQMAALFQIVLMAVHAAYRYLGALGVFASAAVLGLTDVDALTLSMVKTAQASSELALAAQAIAIGVISNTALKLAAIVGIGRGAFRRGAGLGLAALGVASGVAFLLAR